MSVRRFPAPPSVRFRIARSALKVLAFAAVLPSPGAAQSVAAQPPQDIRDVFGPGFMLQDRNLDDVIDWVDARIIVPAATTAQEVAAAANVAARLGFETTALNLDFVGTDAGLEAAYGVPVVVIGARNGLAARARGEWGGALGAGEGAISFLRPDGILRAGGVLVEGGDATGLGAAASYLSGRYPAVWSLEGRTYTDVAETLERFSREREATVDTLTIDRIVVDALSPGVRRAQVTIRVADSASLATLVAAFAEDETAAEDNTRGDRAGAGDAGARGGTRGRGAGPGARGRGAGVAAQGPGLAGAAQDSAQRPVRRADLQFQDLHRIDVRILSPSASEIVRLFPSRPWQTRPGNAFTARDGPDFTLSDLYTIRGLFRDSNQDQVPDRTDAYLSLGGTADAAGAANLAARIGLETAGMRLPFARPAGEDDHPEARGFPILYGTGHYRTGRLSQDGALHTGASPGEGSIELVRGALDGRSALVIKGTDNAALRAISDYVAKRMPYLWEYGKGNYELSDLETDVRRFFQVRETPGQTALAGAKLRTWLDRLDGRDIDSIAIELAVRNPPAGLDAWASALAQQRFPDARTSATTFRTGFGEGRTIFTEEYDIPWEVDEFRAAFRAEVLPQLNASSRGRIEARLSEPPQVRADLEREVRRQLEAKGIADGAFEIVILSAYKQGYSWLHDVVLPRLQRTLATDGSDSGASPAPALIGRIDITYHTLKDSDEVRWQEVESDTRWLQEIFPIDAVFARELGIPDSLITFTATQRPRPIYTIRVLDPAGTEILSDSFDPAYVIRPYFDLFPEYEQVRVTTGHARVEADGRILLDRRIETDPERFWDRLQNETYARIIEYVMDIQDGRPSPANAPYYDEFRVELAMSEPNYRIGIDEEVISSLEALHEDIYFETLQLFDLIGDRYGVGGLAYQGRVLPYIKSGRDGQPGHVKITFTGKERGVPELVVTYREAGREPVRDRYALSPLSLDAPKLRGIAVRAGQDGLSRLLFELAAVDSADTYEQNRSRGSESQIDRTLLSAELLADMVDVLGDMHVAGVAEDALSYDRVGELAFRIVLQDTTKDFSRTVTLARSGHPASTANPKLMASGFRYDGQRLAQWDTPIPPAESDSIMARLATFPGVTVYFVTKSFLGQNTFAADFLPPMEASYISQAKLSGLKPTVMLSGRQHANEVSSTSHILRLGELLATDSSYRELLKKVNVVLHPITNPDGARLAYEMQLENPDFMLHAGYLGALGVDATSGSPSADPIYPESQARPKLQRTWLPDVFINMHGYPSHEWVQYFAGYSAWVRGRTGTQRSWWAPRGWFVPGFSYIEDPEHPEFRTAQFAILDSIAAAIAAEPEVVAMNQRMYARYAKYGRQDVENFREYFRNGILVNQSLRGRPLSGGGRGGGPGGGPHVTYFSITTEAPDETARGEWLDLVATAGLAHSSALIRYMASGVNRIERETAEFAEFVTRNVFRKKPVLPDSSDGNSPVSR